MSNRNIIYSLDSLYKVVHDVKAQGKKICLTSGAFDLFHHSHLDLLQKSSAICDFLIVGVDSDQKVSEYKSYKRPIINQESRMEIINELGCVDAAFVKDISHGIEPHIELYNDLMLDFLTIGHNYSFEEKAREQARRTGVKLIKMRTVQNATTTRVIDAIIAKYSEEEYRVVRKEPI